MLPSSAYLQALTSSLLLSPHGERWEEALGIDDEDNCGDPPRLWAKHLHGPGCAFTRSIGDGAGEDIGVFAEPELVSKVLREQDQFLCLASDGVWEFISSQRVVDMVMGFSSPLEACRAVVAESCIHAGAQNLD